MLTIYKYELRVIDEQSIAMPVGAKILCVQLQHGSPYLWALVDADSHVIEFRTIYTHGTGNPIDPVDCKSYIGTYQLQTRGLVFHVFE